MVLPAINLYKTKEEALSFKNSPINNLFIFGGIQLLPNNQLSYVQVTNTTDGIELEDWVVKLKTVCGTEETDISSSFAIEDLTNSVNGDPQIIWSLSNVNADYGTKLAYLEITQTLGETFYSNSFLITDYLKDRVTQFHYKSERTDMYQSMSFKTWFRQPGERTELTTYYETSTQNTVTQAVKVSKFEIYKTELMSLDELQSLSLVLRSPYLYIDGYRGYLFEAIEFPIMKGDEYYGDFEYKLSINKNDKFVYDYPYYINKKVFNNKFSNIFG